MKNTFFEGFITICAILAMIPVMGIVYLAGRHNGERFTRKEANRAGVGGWVITNDSQQVAEWTWYTNTYSRNDK